uniref:Uncharacterized protein n=1 Tax=Anguilla anguilla TaxID=7936 RepID=A0A0E9UCW1_ANGAN
MLHKWQPRISQNSNNILKHSGLKQHSNNALTTFYP